MQLPRLIDGVLTPTVVSTAFFRLFFFFLFLPNQDRRSSKFTLTRDHIPHIHFDHGSLKQIDGSSKLTFIASLSYTPYASDWLAVQSDTEEPPP